MKNLLDRILRSPDDGVGAGGDPAAVAAAAAAAAGAAGTGEGAGAGAGEGDPAAAAAAAAAAGAGAAADGPYRPEGLADSYHGKDDRETIDKLFKAVDGYRKRDSDNGVPDDIAAYREFGEVDEKLKPYFDTLEGDGLFDDIANKAKELGISKGKLHGLLGVYMEKASEMGVLEAPIDVAAERKALLPDNAASMPQQQQDAAVERRINDAHGWVESMVARGLDKESADHMTMMLGDSAKGIKAIEFFKGQLGGDGNAQPTNGGSNGGGGNDARTELARRSALPENDPASPKFNKASFDQLNADYQKTLPGD
ncbi:hypothetical protein GTW51_10055 [Aurantimonas aggregata]|uniref:Uncharacterized protein n=1 Tax=Aurantimonas aggregata TaxID=2047720 RepID=A0A6L9MGU1_9HYPH|nr:hypothetical protein [Aurantimonas aggregata]NDV87044.1 hypothetical protein [Aurantimonas aggregata]